jgi:uncharacterized damage-inducible protein DinB
MGVNQLYSAVNSLVFPDILNSAMPETALDRIFLDFSTSKLRQLASRIDTCLAQLTEEQVWVRGGDNENAVGNLVLHLCGNLRQWIIASIGGEPDTRQRDAEFAARGGIDIPQLRERLAATVAQAAAVLDSVGAQRLAERLTIQGYEVCVLEDIYHVVEHFAMHAGQIIFITKMLTGADLGFYRHLSARSAPAEPVP